MFDYGESSFFGYNTPGLYTVSMTVTNMVGTSSIAHQVEALPIPSANFVLTRTGASIIVEATDTDATAWEWDFSDGITATGRIATHTYTDTENLDLYMVQLLTYGSNGCPNTGFQYVIQQDEDTQGIPTLSEWGILAFTGVLGIYAAWRLRRRGATL